MPRKSKKSTESETAAAANAAEVKELPELQAGGEGASAGQSDLPAKKATRKKQVKKPAPAASAETVEDAIVDPEVTQQVGGGKSGKEGEEEAAAQAADTFDDAFEANDARETSGLIIEPEPVQAERPKKARAKKVVAKKPEPAPAPQPEEEEDLGPDEDDELAGDWESGTGTDEEEEEGARPTPTRPPGKLERLQKILAAAGVASRRHAEELITEGRVQVNGKIVTALGSKADASRDHIRVDGKLLHGAERHRYFVLNKPRGYVTTVSDPEGRPTVMEFFAKMSERLYPIGRLDYLSEGLLLMTNDGELANKLTRAASGVEKTYLVKVSGQPDEEMIEGLREGVSIDRGRPGEGRVRTSPARIRQVRVGDNPWFEVTLIEGRNRELRKMFEEIGHHVEKIRRVGYGPLVLDLEPGQLRELDPEELNLLRLAADGKWKPKRVKTTAMLPREAGRSVDHEADKRGGAKPFRGERRPAQPYVDRKRGAGERPQYGRKEDRPVGRGAGSRDSERPRFQPGGPGRGFTPGRQDRGLAAGGTDRGQARPRDQDRDQTRAFPREGGKEFGDRGGVRADRGGQRGVSRPQGPRFGGDRPFRGKPAAGGGRFEKPGFEDRPARPGQARPGQARTGQPRPGQVRSGQARPGQARTGPVRPGQARLGEEAGKSFRPRPERPAGGGGGQRFGPRPPRASDGGFRPERRGEGGGARRESRPAFGGGARRESGGRPPARGGAGSQTRGRSGPSAPRGGRPSYGPRRNPGRGDNRRPR